MDSIQVPEDVKAGEPFEVRFYGVVGTDGCHQFSRFDRGMNSSVITLELWGRRASGEDISCPDVMVYLDGRSLELMVDTLKREIQVEES